MLTSINRGVVVVAGAAERRFTSPTLAAKSREKQKNFLLFFEHVLKEKCPIVSLPPR